MKLEQTFEVKAPIEDVWAALTDLERVAPCLPGASITGHDAEGTYRGDFKVKLGPTTASYSGTVSFEELDEANHRAVMKAKGTDKRGQGGATATIVNTMVSVDGGTRVDAVTDYSITGRLASFGRGGMIQDISNRLLDNFSTCLQEQLAPPQAAATPPQAAVAPEPGEITPEPGGGISAATAPATPPATPPPTPPRPAASEPLDGGGLVLAVIRNRLADLLEALAKRLRT